MGSPRFKEIIYIDGNFSLTPKYFLDPKEGFFILGELISEDKSFRLGWDVAGNRSVIYEKDKNGNWNRVDSATYHHRKISGSEYSVTFGDRNGKMILKGIFTVENPGTEESDTGFGVAKS